MKLRYKIISFAIAPLLIALCLIAFVIQYQTVRLGEQQRTSIENAYHSSKDTELRHYVDLAVHAISHLYNTDGNDEQMKKAAISLLSQLDYGNDNYFFVYDYAGNTMVHPRQRELLGKNLWDWKNVDGTNTIQTLIRTAQNGGGFVRYPWQKPSSNTVAPKLSYVIALPKWGWILGTGLYQDDVDAALTKIDEQVSGHNRETSLSIAVIAILSVVIVASLGLLLNVSEQRVADAKLRELAQRVVLSQEEERARVSRDLHDGISQSLVSIKFQTEAAIIKLERQPEQFAQAKASFERTVTHMNALLGEIRHISHNLRPAILDDLGLASALQHLCDEWREHRGVDIRFNHTGNTEEASVVVNTVLFRVAQEALNNVYRHADASYVNVTLYSENNAISLQVRDNGSGFDTGRIAEHPKQGIGLRNMAERLEAVGGQFTITSSPSGTVVDATIPQVSKVTDHV